ncbi:MAG: hypothetical protein PHH49_06355 [Candidatus Omnitrophica bacterium]|nr:hypothetical protein [Candidatus Omnitrophota bacterium]MDD5488562.1 hypothetical protein [Candidatus Omnitrophota bacterium]
MNNLSSVLHAVIFTFIGFFLGASLVAFVMWAGESKKKGPGEDTRDEDTGFRE